MRVGFLFNDLGFRSMDFSCTDEGNPGIGGSEYLFLLLMKYLMSMYCAEVVVYHYQNNRFPEGTVSKLIRRPSECIPYAQEEVDFLVCNVNLGEAWYLRLKNSTVKVVIWAHCYVDTGELQKIASYSQIRQIVFVGRQQYDTYIDHPVISKARYIYNMVPEPKEAYRDCRLFPVVTYVGSIVRGKGFHILAREWKKIVKRVPDAKLYVIGTGKLYDRDQNLGKYGIAESSYEKMFIKYLLDEHGELLRSVIFCGVLGDEKKKIYQKTSVGVVNPSAKTETFCLSAVEMSAYGIPIVTKGKYGLLDTVKHRKTGLLAQSPAGIRRAIVRLLKDEPLNEKLGAQGQKFAQANFRPEKIMPEWYRMFQELATGADVHYSPPFGDWENDWKWLRVCNRWISLKFRRWPAVCQIKRTY